MTVAWKRFTPITKSYIPTRIGQIDLATILPNGNIQMAAADIRVTDPNTKVYLFVCGDLDLAPHWGVLTDLEQWHQVIKPCATEPTINLEMYNKMSGCEAALSVLSTLDRETISRVAREQYQNLYEG